MNKKKITFVNGCFDIIHLGHLQLLLYARKKSNYLMVAINSDKSIKSLKGNNRPINKQAIRKKFLELLNIADKVLIFNNISPLNLIKIYKPAFIVKGSDYKKKNVIGFNEAKKWGGKVIIFKKKNNLSTSKIIKKKWNAQT
jgi:rfaE bifunctional protein nucleotidyltransferase chain/domain